MMHRLTTALITCALALFAPLTPAHEGCDHNHTEHDHDHDHAEHNHAGCDHDHAGHNHAEHEHNHAEHEHNHAEHEHDHAEHEHAGCDHDHAGHAHAPHDAAHSAHEHAAEAVLVQVDARSRHILNMQVETIPETSLALSQSLYGHLTAPAHAQETYALPCAGRIHLHVKSAQQVKKGDVLYTLASPTYADQLAEEQKTLADLARCNSELESLRGRVSRLQQAGARNSELEGQLSFKLAECEQLTRDLEILRTRLRSLAMGAEPQEVDGLPVLTVRAHADGVVHNVGISQNSWGEQGTAVITMSAPAAMEIVGTLYAADLPHIAEVRATLPLGRESVALAGTWRLADQVDATTQTRALYFTPEALPAEARAGQLCRMDIYDAPSEPGIVSIPDSALVKVGTDDVVFLEVGEGRYAMVKVHAGASRRGMTPVAGLSPGQKIVVKGGYELKYSLPTQGETKKAGHFHADGKFHEGED